MATTAVKGPRISIVLDDGETTSFSCPHGTLEAGRKPICRLTETTCTLVANHVGLPHAKFDYPVGHCPAVKAGRVS